MYGITHRLALYEHIKLNKYDTSTAITANADNAGLLYYVKDTSTKIGSLQLIDSMYKGGGSGSSYSKKTFVHTLDSSSSGYITISRSDAGLGIYVLDACINKLQAALDITPVTPTPSTPDYSAIYWNAILTQNSFSSNGDVWINTAASFANPTFKYVNVHIYNSDLTRRWEPDCTIVNNGQYVKIHFDSGTLSSIFNKDTSIYAHILVADAANATTTKTAPTAQSFDTSTAIHEAERGALENIKGLDYGRAEKDYKKNTDEESND